MAQSGYKNGLKKTPKGFWAFKIRVGRKTKTGTFATTRLETAKKLLDQTRDDLLRQQEGLEVKLTVGEALDYWVASSFSNPKHLDRAIYAFDKVRPALGQMQVLRGLRPQVHPLAVGSGAPLRGPDPAGTLTTNFFAVLAVWAVACLGLRLRLHGRLLVTGTPLRTEDWVLRALGARWLPRVSLGLLIVQGVREPSVLAHVLRGLGGRDVLVLVVAGAFRLFATATLWAEFRAVEDHRLHRLDLRASLIWEMAFWVHVWLNTLPSLLWSWS